MRIYLARPGGPLQGPYSLERINGDLAARHYRDDEFWAWHDGLTDWVPLYSIGGVSGAADTTLFFARRASEGAKAGAKPPEPPGPDTTMFLAKPAWLQAAQQAVEPRVRKVDLRPEPATTVPTPDVSASEKPQTLSEPQATAAAVCAPPPSTAKEPIKEPTPEPAKELGKAPIVEPAKEPTKEPASTPAADAPKEPAREPVDCLGTGLDTPPAASGAVSLPKKPLALIEFKLPEATPLDAAKAEPGTPPPPVSAGPALRKKPLLRVRGRSTRRAKAVKRSSRSRKRRVNRAHEQVLVPAWY